MEELTKVNILGKQLQIDILKVSIGSYDDFELICVFDLGVGWTKIDSTLLFKS